MRLLCVVAVLTVLAFAAVEVNAGLCHLCKDFVHEVEESIGKRGLSEGSVKNAVKVRTNCNLQNFLNHGRFQSVCKERKKYTAICKRSDGLYEAIQKSGGGIDAKENCKKIDLC